MRALSEAGNSSIDTQVVPTMSGESRDSAFTVMDSPARVAFTKVITPNRSTWERARSAPMEACSEIPRGSMRTRRIAARGASKLTDAGCATLVGWQRSASAVLGVSCEPQPESSSGRYGRHSVSHADGLSQSAGAVSWIFGRTIESEPRCVSVLRHARGCAKARMPTNHCWSRHWFGAARRGLYAHAALKTGSRGLHG